MNIFQGPTGDMGPVGPTGPFGQRVGFHILNYFSNTFFIFSNFKHYPLDC